MIGICLILIIVSCFTFNKVTFDQDLSKLNYIPQDQKLAEQKLETSSNSISKALYVVNYGTNQDEALQQNLALTKRLEQAEDKQDILSYNSIQSLVLPTNIQQEKINVWTKFWTKEKVDFIEKEFVSEGKKYSFKASIYDDFFSVFTKKYKPLKLEDYKAFNPSLFNEFVSEKDGFYTISTLVKLKEEKPRKFY